MNPRISQAHNPAPMMPYPANMPAMSEVELLRQANEDRNAVIVSGLQRILAGFAGWIQRRRAEAELQALTDRELADIGLARGDIRYALEGRMPAFAPAARAVPAMPSAGIVVPKAANDRLSGRAAA